MASTTAVAMQSDDREDGVATARRGVNPHPDADDQRLDTALVQSTSDAEVAVLAPVRAPRVGAQLLHITLTSNQQSTSTIVSLHHRSPLSGVI